MTHFADDLVTRCRRLGHPLCVGLDPHLDRLPSLFRRGSMAPGDPATVDAVEEFLEAVLDRVVGRVAIVKPQIAFFEALGWRGLTALDRLVARAREAGLLVLLDAKRGDIGSTAAGYARAYLGADAPMRVEALTVNPWLGLDTLEPFVDVARSADAGLFVLVRTSNPGSADLQELRVDGGREGDGTRSGDRSDSGTTEVYRILARRLRPIASRWAGPATGWSSLGVVVGATRPEPSLAVREALPRSLFLVPGYGAQGGSARDAVRSFVPGPAGREGGVVNASRSLLFPAAAATADGAAVWEAAIDAALDRAIGELGDAIAS